MIFDKVKKEGYLLNMKIKKYVIIIVAFLFLAAVPLNGYAKMTVYTSVSVAGAIGGGVYWYLSAGTHISKNDSNHHYSLLPKLYSSQMQLQPAFNSHETHEEKLTIYLPLYSIRF